MIEEGAEALGEARNRRATCDDGCDPTRRGTGWFDASLNPDREGALYRLDDDPSARRELNNLKRRYDSPAHESGLLPVLGSERDRCWSSPLT